MQEWWWTEATPYLIRTVRGHSDLSLPVKKEEKNKSLNRKNSMERDVTGAWRHRNIKKEKKRK